MTVEAPRINPVIAKHNIFLIIILYPFIGLGVIIQFYINMIEKSPLMKGRDKKRNPFVIPSFFKGGLGWIL
jgi:hypothetical protein